MTTATKPVQLGSVASHPLRIKILIALTERVASPVQLAKEFGEDLGTVAYHFRQLLKQKAIHEVDSRPVNGSTEHFYRAIQRPEMSDEESAALSPQKRLEWTRLIVEMFIADVATAMNQGTFAARADHNVVRFPTQVDGQGWEELTEIYARALQEAMDVEARSAGRRAEDPEAKGIPVCVGSFVFEMPR